MKLAQNSWVSSWQSPSGLPKVYPQLSGVPNCAFLNFGMYSIISLGRARLFFDTRNLTVIRLKRLWPFLIVLWGWEVLHHGIRVKIHGSVPRSLWWSSTNWIPGRRRSWIITISIVNDLHIYIYMHTYIHIYIYIYILLSYIIITIFTITIIITIIIIFIPWF